LVAAAARGDGRPNVRLAAAPAGSSTRPNIVLGVVDTLRAAPTTPSGGGGGTTPNLEAALASPGVVFERAYAQAPWTVPSMVALLTGRFPGEVIGRKGADYGIPGTIASLPRRPGA